MRVLLVEDHDPDAMLIQRQLGPGFDLGLARSLSEAVRLQQADPHDLVLLDLRLPDTGGGSSAVGQFLQQCPGADVIVLTGDDRDQTLVRCIKAGAADFVPKSLVLDAPALQQRLKTALVRRSTQQKIVVAFRETMRALRSVRRNSCQQLGAADASQ